MRRLIALLLLAPALAFAQEESAGPSAQDAAPPQSQDAESEAGDVAEIDKDATGPLRERIRPVSGQLYVKRGRFEVSPSASVSFPDAFFTKFVFGGSLTYHPVETLGIGLRGGYALPVVSGAAQICDTQEGGGCRPPTFEDVDGRGNGQIRMLGGLDVQWSPIYGKMSLLAESFAHFDLYALGGVAAVQYAAPRLDAVRGSVPELTFGGNVGVGARFYLNRYMAVRTELRDLIYQERTRSAETLLRNQFLFELGVSFFLPTVVEEL